MTVTRTQLVNSFMTENRLSERKAVLEIHDGSRFVLSWADPGSGAPVETVIDSPLDKLKVRGNMALLYVTANGVRKTIDFSFASRVAMGFGVVGVIAGMRMAAKSGVTQWVAALRAGGADVRYTSWQRMLQISIALAIVIIAIVVVLATSL